jgi:hypothetical protein
MRRVLRLLITVALAFAAAGVFSPRAVQAVGTAPTADIDASAVAMNDLARVDEVRTSAQQKSARSADDVVRELIYEYMEKNGIQQGYNADKEKSFEMGLRTVGANTASPDFGKFRATAFDQAYGDALKAFVKAQAVQVSSQAVSSFFQDSSTKAREFTEELSSGKSTFSALIDKLVALGDAVASSQLSEYGIDADQYSASSPDQKKVLLSETFRRITTERAAKSLGGVVPIQTFIGQDGNGNESVGVLIMYSPKLQAIAEALRFGQKPALNARGPALKDVLPLNEPEKLYDLLGVRVLFDENGVVVVSYGQWANSYSGSDVRLRSRHTGTAFSQAESQANAQISEFLNTNFSSEDYSETGEAMEQALVKEGSTGQIVEPDATAGIVDIRKEVARRRTSALLRGASTLKRWTYATPDGHEIVGVIKTYSFANMEAVKRQEGSTVRKDAPSGSGTPSGRTGDDQMNINTF